MLAYLEFLSVSCKGSTVQNHTTSLRHLHKFLIRTFKTRRVLKSHIRKLNREHIQNYLIYLNQLNVVAVTRVQYIINARSYLAWEVENRNLNPKILILLGSQNLPKVPEYLPRPLNAQTDRKLISILKTSTSPYAPFFLLLRQTGLRISELINLPWNCIVTNEKNESYLKVPPGKLDRERLIPLSDETVGIIEKIKEIYPVLLNMCDRSRLIGIKGNINCVRSLLDGKFREIVGDMTDQNRRITFHRLRHTYATSLLTAGVSIVSIMKLLGHRKIEMSLRYAKVTPTHMRREYLNAVNTIGNQLGLEDHIKQDTGKNAAVHPAEIINHIYSLVRNEDTLHKKQKRVLLQRLSRLKNYLEAIQFKKGLIITTAETSACDY